jgi:hypothetical protein
VGRAGALGENPVGHDLERHVVAAAQLLHLLAALAGPGGAHEDADGVLWAMPQGFTDRMVAIEEQIKLTLP